MKSQEDEANKDEIIRKFKSKVKCDCLDRAILSVNLLINENAIWRKYRNVHSIITFNHYTILFVYFMIITILPHIFSNPSIAIAALSFVLLL